MPENRQNAKRKKEDVNVRSLIQIRMSKLKTFMSTKATFIFNNLDVAETLSIVHEKYVVVPGDKAPNNTIFVCKNITSMV